MAGTCLVSVSDRQGGLSWKSSAAADRQVSTAGSAFAPNTFHTTARFSQPAGRGRVGLAGPATAFKLRKLTRTGYSFKPPLRIMQTTT